MCRISRYALNTLTALSLLLCVATCGLWVRSCWRAYTVGVSRSVWPSANTCVNRWLSVRVVLGHLVVPCGRGDYDLTRPEGIRYRHAMDVPTFRKRYAAGVTWTYSGSDVKLGPQPPIVIDGRTLAVNYGPENYFLLVPLWHGFGRRDPPPYTHLGQTRVEHDAVAPVWPVPVVLAVLPAVWVVQAARRRRRARTGRCRACGYDLRATPDRCPECGTAAKTVGS